MSKVYDLVNVETMSGPITPQRTEHHFIDQLVATNKECNKKIEELENLVRHLESEKKNNEWTIQSLTARCQHLTEQCKHLEEMNRKKHTNEPAMPMIMVPPLVPNTPYFFPMDPNYSASYPQIPLPFAYPPYYAAPLPAPAPAVPNPNPNKKQKQEDAESDSDVLSQIFERSPAGSSDSERKTRKIRKIKKEDESNSSMLDFLEEDTDSDGGSSQKKKKKSRKVMARKDLNKFVDPNAETIACPFSDCNLCQEKNPKLLESYQKQRWRGTAMALLQYYPERDYDGYVQMIHPAVVKFLQAHWTDLAPHHHRDAPFDAEKVMKHILDTLSHNQDYFLNRKFDTESGSKSRGYWKLRDDVEVWKKGKKKSRSVDNYSD